MGIVLSVVVPIHNCESELNKCLDSIFKQNFALPFEVICILDSSNSKTYEIVREYKNNYPRSLRIFETSFRDPGLVRNFGIDKAEGEYIYFIDGDDYLEKNCFKKLYSIAAKSNVDVVIGNFYIVRPPKKRKSSQFFRKLLKDGEYSSETIAKKIINDFNIRGFVWNKLFKKSLLDKYNIRFVPTKYSIEDRPFLLQCVLAANKVYLTKEKTYNYVQHKESFVKATNVISFIQKSLNCDFLLKIILLRFNLFDEDVFRKLLSMHFKGISNSFNKLKMKDEKHKKSEIKKEIKRQKLVIAGSDIYVYGAPWEKATLALNFDTSFYKKLPPSFNIKDLKKIQ